MIIYSFFSWKGFLMDNTSTHNGPSRKTCEETIRRILVTEVLETGTNARFKTAADFMKYFESLYPAGPGLTKQVQRAVKAMDMPKDERGYYIINKTSSQISQDKELRHLLQKTDAAILPIENYETLFLRVETTYKSYLFQLLSESDTLRNKYITALDTSNGILFLTENKNQLQRILESLIN